MANSKFKNINRIRPAAVHFETYSYYTNTLPGTREYYAYWDEERHRCLYGYTADEGTEDALYVTGFHYFYLNYCPIDRAVDEVMPDGSIQSKRERTFPSFYP